VIAVAAFEGPPACCRNAGLCRKAVGAELKSTFGAPGYLGSMPTIPINQTLLRWAMTDLGVGVEQVARSVGRDTSLVYAWLDGSKRPYKSDLEKIASFFGRSTQFFFRNTPPKDSPSKVKYRTSVSGMGAKPEDELLSVRQAERAQSLIRWWAEDQGLTTDLPKVSSDSTASAAAARYRTFLAWNVSDQIKASSKTQVLKLLRSRVEAAGVVVLLTPMGVDNCRGFSLPDVAAPVIAINSDYKLASLRSFTLLHELAHVAKGTPAVCHEPHSQEERWCDQFAAHFLLPEHSVRAYFEKKRWTSVQLDNVDSLRLISNRYGASYQAVALRLKALGLTDQVVVDAVFAYSGEDEGKTGFVPGGKKRHEKRFDEFGSTYTRAVLELRASKKISEIEARKRLRIRDVHELDLLAQHAREAI
jgi:Zn-dependent peptidase ImmA (M78 family)